jgi:hypothetical protein
MKRGFRHLLRSCFTRSGCWFLNICDTVTESPMARLPIQYLMGCVVFHTEPTELMTTFTSHMHAPGVLLNCNVALWTFLNIHLQPQLGCVLRGRFINPDCKVVAWNGLMRTSCTFKAEGTVTCNALNVFYSASHLNHGNAIRGWTPFEGYPAVLHVVLEAELSVLHILVGF